jgi:hypothetical protein
MTEEERILTLEEKVARLHFDVYALQSKMDLMADRKTENSSEIPNNCEDCIWSVCNYNKAFEDEPTISKMEQVDKDINVRSKTEPQTSCKTCRFGEVDEGYVRCAYYSKATEQDEPQTDGYISGEDFMKIFDEPQTVLEAVLDRQTDEDRRKMAESVRKAIKDEPQTERKDK